MGYDPFAIQFPSEGKAFFVELAGGGVVAFGLGQNAQIVEADGDGSFVPYFFEYGEAFLIK